MAPTSLVVGAMASAFFASTASAAAIYPSWASTSTASTALPSISIFNPSPNHKDNIAARENGLIGKSCWRDCKDKYQNPFALQHCLKFCPWSNTGDLGSVHDSSQGVQSSISSSSAAPSSSSHAEQKRQLVSPFPDERYPWYKTCIDGCDKLFPVPSPEVSSQCIRDCFVKLQPVAQNPFGDHLKRSPEFNANPDLPPHYFHHTRPSVHPTSTLSTSTTLASPHSTTRSQDQSPPKESYDPWTHIINPGNRMHPQSVGLPRPLGPHYAPGISPTMISPQKDANVHGRGIVPTTPNTRPHSPEYAQCMNTCNSRKVTEAVTNAFPDTFAGNDDEDVKPNDPAGCAYVCSMADEFEPSPVSVPAPTTSNDKHDDYEGYENDGGYGEYHDLDNLEDLGDFGIDVDVDSNSNGRPSPHLDRRPIVVPFGRHHPSTSGNDHEHKHEHEDHHHYHHEHNTPADNTLLPRAADPQSGWIDPFDRDPFIKCRQQCMAGTDDYAYCTDMCAPLTHPWSCVDCH